MPEFLPLHENSPPNLLEWAHLGLISMEEYQMITETATDWRRVLLESSETVEDILNMLTDLDGDATNHNPISFAPPATQDTEGGLNNIFENETVRDDLSDLDRVDSDSIMIKVNSNSSSTVILSPIHTDEIVDSSDSEDYEPYEKKIKFNY